MKLSKIISNLLIVISIGVGFTMTFLTKEAKWSFYFFAVATGIIIAFSVCILIGNLSKNKSAVDAIEKIAGKIGDNPELIKTVTGLFIKQPSVTAVAAITTGTTETSTTSKPIQTR